MINLPENYLKEIKEILKDEYNDYLDSFNKPSYKGLRVNTLKISVEEFLKVFPFKLEPIPWTDDGFYYEDDKVSKHPFYYAGLYYIQEPSAMLPAQVLEINEDDKVLDTCAAPGGKSTKIITKLKNTGVLISNDISASRCQGLIKNLEHFGGENYYVTSESTKNLKKYFTNYFDKIIVDAPCSGQGMFRKDNTLIKSYLEKDSSYYVPIQKEIITDAIEMLKDGGQLVYSTCTFSKAEDEEIIQYALNNLTNIKVKPLKYFPGFKQNEYGTKLFPHLIKGEGHFVSILEKTKESEKLINSHIDYFKEENISKKLQNGKFLSINDKYYYAYDLNIDTKGLRILRSGLLLGEYKKDHFEPSTTLALSMSKDEITNVLDLDMNDPLVIKYLKGETIPTSFKDGYVLICVNSYPLGFGKVTKGIFKNKYHKGWLYK